MAGLCTGAPESGQDWRLASLVDAEQEYRRGESYDEDRAWWLARLGHGVEPPRVLDQATEPPARIERRRVELDATRTARLREFAGHAGVRPSRVMVAARSSRVVDSSRRASVSSRLIPATWSCSQAT